MTDVGCYMKFKYSMCFRNSFGSGFWLGLGRGFMRRSTTKGEILLVYILVSSLFRFCVGVRVVLASFLSILLDYLRFGISQLLCRPSNSAYDLWFSDKNFNPCLYRESVKQNI